jgi:hypothetical protein
VQALIMERFDAASNNSAALPPSSAPEPQTNGHSSPIKARPKVKSETPQASTPDEDEDEDEDVVSPPKKKRKQAKPVDNDAKLAAMLQAQENSRARPTRGGNEKKRVVKKAVSKKPKKKSADKVKKDDDSDMGELDSDGEVKEKVKKGGFHVSLIKLVMDRGGKLTRGQKQYHLSAPLADLVGEPTVSIHAPSCFCHLESDKYAVISTPSRQENMGVYQSSRPSRPLR